MNKYISIHIYLYTHIKSAIYKFLCLVLEHKEYEIMKENRSEFCSFFFPCES